MRKLRACLLAFTLTFVAHLLFTHLAFSGVSATFNKKFVDDIPKRVAVIPQDEGSFDLMELAGVVTSVLMSLDFEVVERTSLDLLLKEYKLSLSGLLSNKDPEIGRLLNIDGIVLVSRTTSSYSRPETTNFATGQMTNYTYAVTSASVKLIDVYSGAIVYQFNYQCDTGKMSLYGGNLGKCTDQNPSIGKYLQGDLSKRKKMWGEFRISSNENVNANSMPKTDLSLKGKVEFVGKETLWIDVGAKQGVRVGDMLYVRRNESVIGKAKVRTVYDDRAEAVKIEGDNFIIDDEVSYVAEKEIKPLGNDDNKTQIEATETTEAKTEVSNKDETSIDNGKAGKEIIGKIEGIGNEKAWINVGDKQGLVIGDMLYLIRDSKIIGKVKITSVNDTTSEIVKVEGEEPVLGDEVRCLK